MRDDQARVVRDALADAVWGGALPGDHVAALEHYVSVIRRRLQADGTAATWFIVTRSGGYLFDPGRAALDWRPAAPDPGAGRAAGASSRADR